MKLGELPTYLDAELSYPTARDDVIDSIGGLEIDAPDRGESETVATILGDLGDDTYRSADELFDAILGNVSDEYIGRKFYDDRGGDPIIGSPGPRDEEDTSF